MITRSMIRLAVCMLCPLCAGAWGADFEARWSSLEHEIDDLLTEQGMVGGAVWFFEGAEPRRVMTFGLADLEQDRPVDRNTIFHWASITKTFTGIAIMQLRDRGLLRLDDPVVDHLPEVAAIHSPFGPIDELTIRHVMTHSTGLRAATWPWGGDEPWHPFEPTEWAQLVAMFPYTALEFRPGTRYAYSNPAVILLGRIIEERSGEPYETYVHKNILMPLRMHRTYFDNTPYHLIDARSNNYTVVDGRPKPNGLDIDTGITVSNSGLNAPVGDLGRYAAFLMGEPGREAAYEGVLARRSLEEMFEPRLAMTDPVVAYADPVDQQIGLAFFVINAERGRLIGHTGSQRGFRSFLYVDPDADVAAIAAFNTDRTGDSARPDAEQVLATVRELVFQEMYPTFRSR